VFDPASISAALGSAKTILDLLKNANDAQLAIKISSEIANVQGRLIDVQQQALDLQQENHHLRGEIEKSRSYRQHHSVIWKLREGREDGPYCPACLGEGRDMRLILRNHVDQSGDHWFTHCPKGHVDPREKAQGFTPRKEDPTFKLPKSLVPDDYFYPR
jgi:hypothetical protein